MRLVQKKCPNCGATIDFDENIKKVKCAYCGQTYVIEKDNDMIKNQEDISKHLDDAFELVAKVQAPFAAVSIFIFVFIFIIFIAMFIFNFTRISSHRSELEEAFENNVIENTILEEVENPNLLVDFSQIDDDTMATFHKETVKKLNDSLFASTKSLVISDWSYVGMYLIIDETFEDTDLIDVYEIKYKVKGVEYHFYGGVQYYNLELNDDGFVVTNFGGSTLCPTYTLNLSQYDRVFLSGYESLEELYNKEVREHMTSSYSIKYTDGVYMVKAN
ncbi:MAG: hypothetical protein IJ475_00960 [Bacilli bacterium]|nr:hypothetical protein [Bacilli bacterium]